MTHSPLGDENVSPDPAPSLPEGRALVPIKQAAPLLMVSARTLWAQIHAGTIQHRRIGGRVFMLWPDDFDAAIESAKQPRKSA